MIAPFTKSAVLEILRTPAASDTFPDMIRRVEALEGGGVRVKALVFEEAARGLWSSGMILGGEYRIKLTGGQGFQVSRGMFAIPDNKTWFATLEAAKTAAQADYEARILAALEPVAQPETPTPGQFTTMCLAIEDVVTGRGFDVDPWRSIKDDPPPLGADVLGFWQYMYPGDKSRTCGYEVGEVRADGTFVDHEGQHDATLFTHWQPLNPPGETTSAIPEEVKAYMRNVLMVGGWKGE